MKKLFMATFLLVATTSLFGQNNTSDNTKKRHEIKFNVFNTLVFKSPSASYEFLIDDESSVGISVLANLIDKRREDYFIDLTPVYNENYSITPYYRRFFSSKPAWGFFVEAFGMFNEQEDKRGVYTYNPEGEDYYVYTSGVSNNFAMGVSVGGKFVTHKGFSFEFFGGIGRNIYKSNEEIATEAVPRLGILLGYRF